MAGFTQAEPSLGSPDEMLQGFDQTIDALGRLLADVRSVEQQRDDETDALREEIRRLQERELALTDALERLRAWLAIDAEAMDAAPLAPAPDADAHATGPAPAEPRTVESGLAGIRDHAGHLKDEAAANLERARVAERARREAERALEEADARAEALTASLAEAEAERDRLRERLDEHERLLEAAGLEIEWRPARRGSR